MPRVYRTPQSREDYLSIWIYIARDNGSAADNLIESFDATLVLLSHSPEMGRLRKDLPGGVWSFPVKSYLIFYRKVPDGIQLLRVIRGGRDIPNVF